MIVNVFLNPRGGFFLVVIFPGTGGEYAISFWFAGVEVPCNCLSARGALAVARDFVYSFSLSSPRRGRDYLKAKFCGIFFPPFALMNTVHDPGREPLFSSLVHTLYFSCVPPFFFSPPVSDKF